MKKLLLSIVAIAIVHSSFAQWATSGNNIYNSNSGNVGIGTTTPAQKFAVSNNGAEGLEIYLAQPTGVVGLQSYNRMTSTYNKMEFDASVFSFAYGNVGIGTTSPSDILDVKLTTSGSTGGMTLRDTYPFARLYDALGGQDAGTLDLLYQNTTNVKLNSNGSSYFNGGNIGIGTTSPDQLLTVNGTIHSTEVKVDLNVTAPDYVFDTDYKLPNLNELKAYLDKNHHLPEIPSAEQMTKDGLNLSDMNTKLLKKVEELTLYLIEKDNEVKRQEQVNQQQAQTNQSQQKQINELKSQLSKLIKQQPN